MSSAGEKVGNKWSAGRPIKSVRVPVIDPLAAEQINSINNAFSSDKDLYWAVFENNELLIRAKYLFTTIKGFMDKHNLNYDATLTSSQCLVINDIKTINKMALLGFEFPGAKELAAQQARFSEAGHAQGARLG